MLNRFLYLVFIVMLAACNNAGDQNNADKPQDSAGAATENNELSSGKNFYKRLQGKIGNQEVVGHLSKFEGKIFFTYYYVSQGIPIGLYNYPDKKLPGDSIELTEYDRLRKTYDMEQDNKWRVVITENAVKGKWIGGDGKTTYNISLQEHYPAGAHLFNVVGVKDSLPVTVKNDTVMATSFMMLMEPADAAVGGWYKHALLNTFSDAGSGFSGTILQYIENETKKYFKDYRAEIDTLLKKNVVIDGEGPYHWLNYANELNANALYNDHHYLVMNIGSYTYTGGAHGLEGRTAVCYDMKEKKEMQLSDVISIDSVSLQKLVEKHFREQSGLKTGQLLTEILFENKLPANDNFYFTNKGLGFIYQPYEVAAYAVGIIYVFIPYTHLKPYLNPRFAQRMEIP